MFNFDGKTTLGVWANIPQAAPDMFFVISGFILMNSTWRPLAGWHGFADFATRRFFRIYPIYWFVGIPVLAVWLWNPSCWSPYLPRNPHAVVNYIIASVFLLPQNHMPVLVVAWTLIYEVYFYLIVSFIFLLDVRGRMIAAGFWILAIVLLNIFQFHRQAPVWTVITSPLSLEFIAGIYLGAAYRMNLPRLPSSVAVAICVLAFSLIVWASLSVGDLQYFYDHHRARVLCFGPAVVAIIAVALWMEKQGSWTTLGKLSFIGDRSYSFYLLHIVILQMIFRGVLRLEPHPSAWVISLATILALVILVPVTELFYQTVELRFIRLGSKSGRKSAPGTTPLASEAAAK